MEVKNGLEEEKVDFEPDDKMPAVAPEVVDIRGSFEDFMVRVNGRLPSGGVYERK